MNKLQKPMIAILKDNKAAIARAVRALRKRHGLTCAAMAKELGVHPRTVLKWERGERVPGRLNMKKLDGMGRPG